MARVSSCRLWVAYRYPPVSGVCLITGDQGGRLAEDGIPGGAAGRGERGEMNFVPEAFNLLIVPDADLDDVGGRATPPRFPDPLGHWRDQVAQQPGPRVDELLAPNAETHRPRGAFANQPRIRQHHLGHVLQDVELHGRAAVDALADFRIHLIPRPPDATPEESHERREVLVEALRATLLCRQRSLIASRRGRSSTATRCHVRSAFRWNFTPPPGGVARRSPWPCPRAWRATLRTAAV